MDGTANEEQRHPGEMRVRLSSGSLVESEIVEVGTLLGRRLFRSLTSTWGIHVDSGCGNMGRVISRTRLQSYVHCLCRHRRKHKRKRSASTDISRIVLFA